MTTVLNSSMLILWGAARVTLPTTGIAFYALEQPFGLVARRSAALAQCGVLLCTHPKHPSLLTHFSCLLLSWLYINRAHMMVVGALCTVITDNLSAIAMLCQHSVSVFCVCVEVHVAVQCRQLRHPVSYARAASCPCCLPAARRSGELQSRRVVLTTRADLRIPLHTYGFHQLVRPNV